MSDCASRLSFSLSSLPRNRGVVAFVQRTARQYDEASYALTARLLELNPDFYSLFNYRKEIVLHMIQQK